jgi:hypothetical protein
VRGSILPLPPILHGVVLIKVMDMPTSLGIWLSTGTNLPLHFAHCKQFRKFFSEYFMLDFE